MILFYLFQNLNESLLNVSINKTPTKMSNLIETGNKILMNSARKIKNFIYPVSASKSTKITTAIYKCIHYIHDIVYLIIHYSYIYRLNVFFL